MVIVGFSKTTPCQPYLGKEQEWLKHCLSDQQEYFIDAVITPNGLLQSLQLLHLEGLHMAREATPVPEHQSWSSSELQAVQVKTPAAAAHCKAFYKEQGNKQGMRNTGSLTTSLQGIVLGRRCKGPHSLHHCSCFGNVSILERKRETTWQCALVWRLSNNLNSTLQRC